MTKKIFKSIFGVTAIVVTLGLVFVLLVLGNYFGNISTNQLRAQTDLAAQGVALNGIDYFTNLSLGEYRITWISSEGKVLYDNEMDASTMESHKDREEFKEAITSGYGHSERYSAMMSVETIYSAKKCADGSVIRVSETQKSIVTLVWGMLWPLSVILFLALVFSYILAEKTSKRLVEPLNNMDLDHPLENDTYEEIAPLLRRMEHQNNEIDDRSNEIRKKQAEINSIMKNMSEALVLLNEKGKVVILNESARKLFGVENNAEGENFIIINHSFYMQDLIERAQESGHAKKEVEINGSIYQMNVNLVKNGGLIILAFDISERVESEKRRREFTANVSHELKTPLQTIMGSAELLENGLVKNEDKPEFIKRIRKESQRLLSLINDIIRLSQLDENQVNLEKEKINIASLVRDIKNELENKATVMDITVRTDLDDVDIIGVKQLIREIIYNLTENAIKYNKKGGFVDIKTYKKDDMAILIVSDTGCGIPKEDQARVFERFYRVDKSHSKETGGTGLGLSIVKHAVKYHEATIELSSEINKGTVIKVKFHAV